MCHFEGFTGCLCAEARGQAVVAVLAGVVVAHGSEINQASHGTGNLGECAAQEIVIRFLYRNDGEHGLHGLQMSARPAKEVSPAIYPVIPWFPLRPSRPSERN